MSDRNLGEWPYFEDEEINLVSSILKSGKVNYWTGNYGKEFEKNFEVWSNSNHALSIANGTAQKKSVPFAINNPNLYLQLLPFERLVYPTIRNY